ncbi:MAG: HNH endonuclease, partial [Gammaproteobacteria bacterium]|nr:HNH endonuclease [Gammaproteobacteria bacterium]
MDKTCQQCGKAFQTRKKERKYCSKACYGAANRAENSVHWKGENLTNTCEVCGKTFRCGSTKVAKKRKYCSPECHGKVNTSSNNPTWKGGYTTKTGYHTIRIEGKLQYTHRMIIENHLGRPLKDNEVVHHINGDPSDNRIE